LNSVFLIKRRTASSKLSWKGYNPSRILSNFGESKSDTGMRRNRAHGVERCYLYTMPVYAKN